MGQGKISAKQQEILDYIKSQILERGFPPAVRDICEAVHLKSTSSVHSHLETLEVDLRCTASQISRTAGGKPLSSICDFMYSNISCCFGLILP